MKKLFHILSPLLSRRLMMTLLGIYILRNSFWGIVTGLSGLEKDTQITAYTTMASWYFTALSAAIMSYLGVTTWKGGMTVASVLQSNMESSTQEITERIFNVSKLDPKDLDEEAGL